MQSSVVTTQEAFHSKHFNERQMRAVDKLGEVMISGFTASKCSRSIDRILDYMPESDRKDLGLLLTLLSFFPRFLLRGYVELVESSQFWPDWCGSLLRFMRIGLRGLIMTLYYSDTTTLQKLAFKVDVFTEDCQ